MIRHLWVAGAALLLAGTADAQPAAPTLRPDQVLFRALYKEMVETNTTRSVGSCTALAGKIEDRLAAAGFAKSDLHAVPAPMNAKWGSLVAVMRGSDPKAKAMLLVAHLDVVEANRADWVRDPFVLTEENGVYYGRGSSDDKAQAAVWVDTLIRLKAEGFRPRRDIKVALTCGEETPDTFDGIEWLTANRRDLIDAEFALNEGAGGLMEADGRRIALNIQAGQKVYQNFKAEAVNAGGHSSVPIRDNAIYELSAALIRLRDYDFPVELSDGNRAYLNGMSALVGGEAGAAMKAVAADPLNAQAAAVLSKSPSWNSMLRTTCVATQMDAGPAANALPQQAAVNINCRIFPGRSDEETRVALERVIADPKIKVSAVAPLSPTPPPPPLTRAIMGPVEKVAAKLWPGTPVVPVMATGASDGRFLSAVGIPTYGISGFFADAAGSNAHGLNEHIAVRSLMEGRDFLHELVKLYAVQK